MSGDEVHQEDIDALVSALKTACDEAGDGSEVFLPGSEGYEDSHRHYVVSSSYPSHAAVQPSTTKGLVKILAVVKKLQVPFSVKGGGHSMAPFYPPRRQLGIILPPSIPFPQRPQTQTRVSPWMQISMSRFKDVIFNEADETVEVGAGCILEEVYTALKKVDPPRNIVGGVSSVGVAGFFLGGGFSFLKTNRFGLGIDNTAGYEVVLPSSGEIKNARPGGDTEDLFHALRGGGANFGVVTKFILKTHKQSPFLRVETLKFPSSQLQEAKDKIISWIKDQSHPEDSLEAAFRYNITAPDGKPQLEFETSVVIAVDGDRGKPQPVEVALASINLSGSLKQEQGSYFSFSEVDALISAVYEPGPIGPLWAAIKQGKRLGNVLGGATAAAPSIQARSFSPQAPTEMRGRFGCVMVHKYTPKLIDEIHKQAEEASKYLKDNSGISCLTEVWPFLPTIFDHGLPGAAWPHEPGKVFGPCLASFRWTDKEKDGFWLQKMTDALNAIRQVAESEGVTTHEAPVYLNTTLEFTPVGCIYQGNLEHLKGIRVKYDPDDVMSLTGGFKISLPVNDE